MAANLRSFESRDHAAVLELSRLASTRPELQVGNPVWTTREQLESEIRDWDPPAGETLFVMEEQRRVIGFGGVELPRGFDHGELFGPLVAAAARGRGIGANLLEAAIERSRLGGVASLLGAAGVRNAAARILLEGHGFRPRGGPQAAFRLAPGDHRPVEDAAPVDVRTADPGDLEAAVGLYRECFPGGRFSEEVWRANVDAGTVYVAEAEGAFLGVLNIDPADRWIYHVGVTGDARRRGIAATLLSRSLEDYWRRHPDQTLGLDVDADNAAAIRLYRRQGFAPWLVLQTFELAL